MRWDDVREVLDVLDAVPVRHWVGGGWGVDALVGRETRPHRDLDLLVDADGVDRAMSALADLGYEVETDWLPLRVEVRASGDRWVDVHPVRFGADGHGIQGDLDGVHFRYPPTAFAHGRLGSRTVACLSVAQQLDFHSGYEHRPQDVHDVRLLEVLAAGVPGAVVGDTAAAGVRVVALGARCDYETAEEQRASALRAAAAAAPPVAPEHAAPGVHVPDEADLAVVARQANFSIEEFATLADRREITLSDDRGWSSSGPSVDEVWAALTIEAVERDVRAVVLPDDAEETGDEHPWAWFAATLRTHGVAVTSDDLRRLPYDVILSERLRERLDATG